MYDALTNLSISNYRKRSEWASDQCLARLDVRCLASCGQFIHLFCMQSNAILHFYCSLNLFVSSANSLICLTHRVVHLFCYRMRSNLRSTTGELRISSVWNTEIWYRTVWNIIDTGNFTVPVYHASLVWTITQSHIYNISNMQHARYKEMVSNIIPLRYNIYISKINSMCSTLFTIRRKRALGS